MSLKLVSKLKQGNVFSSFFSVSKSVINWSSFFFLGVRYWYFLYTVWLAVRNMNGVMVVDSTLDFCVNIT